MGLRRLSRDSMIPLVVVGPLVALSALNHTFNLRAATSVSDTQAEKKEIPLPLSADAAWPRRSLTAGEMVLASRFFGPALKLHNITIHNGGEQPDGFFAGAQAFNGMDMAFYGPKHYSDDFSKETDVWKFGAFFHEVAHLVHHQKNMFTDANFRGDCRRRYEYEIIPGKEFEDYCIEQQATLVEDYARRFLLFTPAAYRHGNLEADSDEGLAAVVEKRFPGARELRAEMEQARFIAMEKTLERMRLKDIPSFMLPTIEVTPAG